MKNLFSNAVIAAAIALAVPNNGAEAVGTVGMVSRVASVQSYAMPATVSVTEQATANVSSVQSEGTPDPTLAWLMALGFLGLVVARRVRGQ
jgi:MYXO-CTERM domain-containing protein